MKRPAVSCLLSEQTEHSKDLASPSRDSWVWHDDVSLLIKAPLLYFKGNFHVLCTP